MFFSKKSKEEKQAKAQERYAELTAKIQNIQMRINIVSGERNITMGNKELTMIQSSEGIVEFKHIPGRFLYTGYEYGDKSQRSAGKAAAGALIGGALTGGAGAIVGAAIGGRRKDKSTAVVYLINENTGKEFEITIRCDGALHTQLGRFSVATSQQLPGTTVASNPEELLTFKNLLDAGAITEEEYSAKKQQILGL